MVQVTHSPFLQALGYSILNSLWQFGLLWLIYLFINCVVKLSSHKKYAAGIALQFSGFIWFCLTLIFYYNQFIYLANAGNSSPYELNDIAVTTAPDTFREIVLLVLIRGEQFLPYLSVAYLLLLGVLAAKWIKTYRFTNALTSEGLQKINVDYRLFVEKICRQLGIKRSVKVYLSALVKSPLTIGFLKPVILIPFASLNQLTTDQVEAVLLHELAHIKRYDYLINLLLSVIEVALFFNPFMQLISRHVKRERENSCDDWVLQYEYNAATYARALLKLATFNSPTSDFSLKAVDKNHTLLIRVKRMIEKKDRSYNYRNQLFALLLISGVLSSIAWFTPTSSPHRMSAIKNANQNQVAEPMAASVSNPLFNPVFFLVKKKEEKLERQIQTNVVKAIESIPPPPPAGNPAFMEDVFHINNETFQNLPEASQQIVNASSDKVNNTLAVLNNLQLRLDTIQLKNDFDILFKNLSADWVTETKNAKDVNEQLTNSKNFLLSLALKSDKVRATVEKSFAHLKVNILSSARNTLKEMERAKKELAQQEAAAKYHEQLYNKAELKALNDALQQQVEKTGYNTNQQYSINGYSANTNQPPVIIYTVPNVEPAHTFSYAYTDRGIGNIRITTTKEKKEKKEIQRSNVEDENEAEDNDEIEQTPAPPPAKRTLQLRKIIKIIRI